MLDLTAVDLDALVDALEDHSDDHQWYVDPHSGEVLLWADELEDGGLHPEERGALVVEPVPSHEGYRDMQDFVCQVSNRRAADLLERAIEGRGAFRRFKDTLFEFPELRQAWFAFHDVRMRRRAVEWLADADLVESSAADAVLETLEDPPVGQGTSDPLETAQRVATAARELLGDRLVDVVVFGSHATRTATDESDLDIAVVLRDVESAWEDARLLDAVLWDATRESGITVSAVVVDSAEWAEPRRPLLRTAKAQGRSVV